MQAWHDQEPVPLGGLQRRCVLAVLLLHAGQVVPLDRIAELVWGEFPPADVRNAVQSHVSRLRQVLSRDPAVRVTSRSPGYLLYVNPTLVDVFRFRGLAAKARTRADRRESSTLLREALRLWRGRPLADVATSESLQRLCVNLDEERLAATQDLYALELSFGHHDAVLGELAALVAEHPLRERLVELWVLALYRCGRQSDALAELQRIHTRLVDELGVEPGPELRALRQRILNAVPELDWPRPADIRDNRPAPALLPPEAAGFCGRDAELAELERRATSATTVVISAISGTAGVGKTALALHWAHRVRNRFPDGQLYVDLRGYGPDQPMPVGVVLTRFLKALGVAARDIPLDVDERVDRYRTEISDRRMLILLDNVASTEQVRPLLPGSSSCMVLVTSRDSLRGLVVVDGVSRLVLDLLSDDEAITLLRRLIGPRADLEQPSVRMLAEQCARLPLALRVAAELANAHPATPLADLVEELADRQRRLHMLNTDGDPRAALRVVFSWSYHHLPAATAVAFRRFGLHPGPHLSSPALAALCDVDVDTARRQLDALVAAHLARPAGPDQYGMHDLLRAYAFEMTSTDDSEAIRSAALTRLFDVYLAAAANAIRLLHPAERPYLPRAVPPATPVPRLAGQEQARAWLDAELPNLTAVCAHTGAHHRHSHTISLANTLYRHLESGHHTEAVAIHNYALRAAGQLDDPRGRAHALTNLGAVHRLLGSYDLALNHLRSAVELHRGTGDQLGEARSLSNLGVVEERVGQLEPSVAHLELALSRYHALGDQYGQAAVLTNLGCGYLRPGHYSTAVTCLERARELFRETGDLPGEGSALANLGTALLDLGNHAAAATHLDAALDLFRRTNHRYGQATVLSTLGRVLSKLGKHDEAVDHIGQAITLFRQNGHRYGEASALNDLGEACRRAGRLDDARTHHAAALQIATDTGDHDERDRANAGIAIADQDLHSREVS